jgi:hypothetical protein
MRKKRILTVLFVVTIAAATWVALASVKPPAEPAKLDLTVSPKTAAAGDEVEVTLRLRPKPGIKVNRYPRITLKVAAVEGLVGAGQASVGNDEPPPPDKLETNYFKTVDPVVLRLTLDAAASSGEHVVSGDVKYFYCVAASGFCAPKKVTVQIPVTVQ